MILSGLIFGIFIIAISYFLFKHLRFNNEQSSKLDKPIDPQYITYAQCSTDQRNVIKIITYNILIQDYVKRKDTTKLSLANRMESIHKEIIKADPDLLCFQEATYESYTKYIEVMLGSIYIMVPITNDGSGLMTVTCFKKERFELRQQFKFDLSNANVTGNRGIIHTLLYDKYTQKEVSLYNVHFPWRPVFEYEKGYILLRIFEHIITMNKTHVIIAGDFNSLPNSIVLRMIYYDSFIKELEMDKNHYTIYNNDNFQFNIPEQGLMNVVRRKLKKSDNFRTIMVKLQNISQDIYDNYCFRSSYDDYQNNINTTNPFAYLRNHPQYTNFTNNFKETIDYIFYSKTLKRLKIASLPLSKEYMPNNQFPSDHIKLHAEFEIIA